MRSERYIIRTALVEVKKNTNTKSSTQKNNKKRNIKIHKNHLTTIILEQTYTTENITGSYELCRICNLFKKNFLFLETAT